VNCTKMRLAAGLRPDPLGRSPSRYNGEGGKVKEMVGNSREGRKGRKGEDVKW